MVEHPKGKTIQPDLMVIPLIPVVKQGTNSITYLAVYAGHEEVLLAAHHALEPRALYQQVAGHARAATRRRAARVARPRTERRRPRPMQREGAAFLAAQVGETHLDVDRRRRERRRTDSTLSVAGLTSGWGSIHK